MIERNLNQNKRVYYTVHPRLYRSWSSLLQEMAWLQICTKPSPEAASINPVLEPEQI